MHFAYKCLLHPNNIPSNGYSLCSLIISYSLRINLNRYILGLDLRV